MTPLTHIINMDVYVGVQYNGKGMYCAVQIKDGAVTTLTPWTNNLMRLDTDIAASGIELSPARPPRTAKTSVWLYVDGQCYGVDVLELALSQNKTLNEMKRELKEKFAPAQATFRVEKR